MNKLLLTIATLFAYSGMFSQTWNTGTGAWISPLSKNIGIQKSLQVGDNVGTDSLWCKTDLNYFEGSVGIGTITPEAKLHVSISDTTGVEIAHLENNIDHAIITVHTHSDSSALYGLQTEDFNSAYGLNGVTGQVILADGLGIEAIVIDTTGSVTIPDLAGSGTRLVTASATGVLDTANAVDVLGYKVYTALLTQTGTNAPVATVLQNTLGGTVVWSYNAVGDYTATATGLLTSGKTIVYINGAIQFDGGLTSTVFVFTYPDSFQFLTLDNAGAAIELGAFPFSALYDVSIEIRVYP